MFVLLTLTAGVFQARAAETLAHWTFGEHGLADVSGNDVALTATNVEFGDTGYATLNGTTAWLETAGTLDLTAYSQLTVECWIRPETMIGEQADFGPLFQHYAYVDGANVPGSFVTYFSASEHSFRSQLRDAGDKWTISMQKTASGLPYVEGGWHHVALVMDITGAETGSGKSKLYVDGELIPGLESAPAATIRNFLDLKFVVGGGGDYVPGRFFRGDVDDIRITAGCLTPDQFLKFPTIGWKMSAEKPEIAFWPFGTDGVRDVTGNGFDLEARWDGVGFGNGCAQFAGTGGLIYSAAFPAHAFSNTGLTYEFFFRTTSTSDSLAMLLENSGSYSSAPGRLHVRLDASCSTLRATIRTLGGEEGYNTSIAREREARANDGAWHHVAVVYDPKGAGAERLRVYQDGALLVKYPGDSNSDNLACLAGDCSLFLGARAGTDLPFVGEMDDVRVMPWALRPAEFLRTRTVCAPLAHWRFDNAETALTDLTGNGNDLVNQNGVRFEDGSASFNGQNANLITAETLDLSQTKQLTVEGRFWFDDTQKLNVLFDTGDTDTPGGFVVYGHNGALMSQFRYAAGKWNQYVKNGFHAFREGWHHVAFVVNLDNRNAAQSQMWFDGELCACDTYNRGFSNTLAGLLDTKLSFGGGGAYGSWAWDDPNYHSSFKGRISEVVVSPAELTPATFRLLNPPAPARTLVAPKAQAPVSLALDLTDTADVTVECYAQFGETPAGAVFAFTPAGGGPAFSLAVADGALAVAVVPTTGGSNAETAAAPADGAWHHLALVVDSRTMGAERVRLYVDGVRSDTHGARVNWAEAFGAGTLTVGADFAGRISSLRVTAGALEPEAFLTARKTAGMAIVVR